MDHNKGLLQKRHTETEFEELKEELEEAKSIIEELEGEISDLKRENEDLASERDSYLSENQSLEDRCADLENELEEEIYTPYQEFLEYLIKDRYMHIHREYDTVDKIIDKAEFVVKYGEFNW